jgi:hypothetical protein
MTMTSEQLESAVLALKTDERVRIYEKLRLSLEIEDEVLSRPTWEKAWLDEAERRRSDPQAEWVEGDQVFREARAALRAARIAG